MYLIRSMQFEYVFGIFLMNTHMDFKQLNITSLMSSTSVNLVRRYAPNLANFFFFHIFTNRP